MELGQLDRVVGMLFKKPDSALLASFVAINGVFMLVEAVFGIRLRSTGSVTHGVHSAFDTLTLVVALLAMASREIYADRPPYINQAERHEVLAAFTNACLFTFMSWFLILEAVHELVGIHGGSEGDDVGYVAMVEACVSVGQLVALRLFVKRKGGWSHYYKPFEHLWTGRQSIEAYFTARESNIQVIFVHLVADAAASSLVAVTSLFLGRGWARAMEPWACILLACLLLTTLVPIAKSTGEVLLQGTPLQAAALLNKLMNRVCALPHCVELQTQRFWTLAPGVYVGALHVQLEEAACEESFLEGVHRVTHQTLDLLTVQLNKAPRPDSRSSSHDFTHSQCSHASHYSHASHHSQCGGHGHASFDHDEGGRGGEEEEGGLVVVLDEQGPAARGGGGFPPLNKAGSGGYGGGEQGATAVRPPLQRTTVPPAPSSFTSMLV